MNVMIGVCRATVESLPGRLLLFTLGFVMLAQLLIFLPLAAQFRTNWLSDQAETAFIAALAADVAEGGTLGDVEVSQLLEASDAVAVARVTEGRNELVLYGGPIDARLIEADLRRETWWGSITRAARTFTITEERFIRIIANPQARPADIIDVIVPEAPLKAALLDYSVGLLQLSLFIAVVTGVLLYVTLLYAFVRPMRQLAAAMARFQKDPMDPKRAIVPDTRKDEIGQAQRALAAMQEDVRAALKQRERLAALGAAMAKINHDLRNVLAAAQLVSDRLVSFEDERVRKMGARMVRAVGRGIRLTEATLQYGRAEESPPQTMRLNLRLALDEAAADAMATEGEGVWNNEIAEGTAIEADPDHVHRIFLNLFRNAIQAMTLVEREIRLLVSSREDDGFIRIEVTDGGPGLPSKAQDNLFQPFTSSTRREGTGLGLTTARELARAHGGDIVLVRTGEGGTVFAVTLPGVD
ncbi:HAMP domain-containing histidine kinase [Hyphobacterium sp. CCMP332]|uniref:sensor histidine kinase n=1 Tax=Hyphobacterium sp. CCMP332 TaxID=2749086 RepID=UPI00164F6BBF|nr:HAMP domain-containing sensor histidine kinase [Hyphobacterium sp. CCMP332]QNL19419.1 HAMP domain-containing histidine kinase [Hyphobacterium sp. CCMP332]